ncbi:MAG: MoaD/ThiS family protein [Deltaproteobacteria bacterium]|nr:MoaD/ThiS family protein [Deltaproteobacteria bacterium]
MNIKIEFIGFPVIYDIFPEGPHTYTFTGETVLALVKDIVGKNVPKVKESLMETKAETLDPTIQIRINGKFFSKDEISLIKIAEGDQVAFLKLLAGG